MSLRISERLVGDVTVVTLVGRITIGEPCEFLRQTIKRLLNEGKKKILMDLSDMTYVDSGGNGIMVAMYTIVRNQGGALKLLNVVGKYRETLQVTKLYTVYEVFYNEREALKSFESPPLRCHCPACGSLSGPPVLDQKSSWPAQTCSNRKCESRFIVITSQTSQDEALVISVRIQTYKDEYFEILPGPPFTVPIVGRLDLFSSSALKKTWQTLPQPRRVLFDLRQATEIDDAGRDALLSLLASREEGAKAVVSLEGLSCMQVNMFPAHPPFYSEKAAALAALANMSDAFPWTVKIDKSP